MVSEIYVTAFSKTSDDNYPTTKLSNFTYTLPVPINLSPDNEWEVGIVNIYHSPIIGLVDEKRNDNVTFQKINIEETKDYGFNEFIKLVAASIKNPSMYSKEYFDDFYDVNNLKNFKTNATIQKHKCEAPTDSTKTLKIKFNGIHSSVIKADHVNMNNWPYPENFLFELDKNYTLNQILYLIVKQSIDSIEKEASSASGTKLKDTASYKKRMPVQEYLLCVVRTFVIHLAVEQRNYFQQYFISGQGNQYEMFLHADITAPQNFNNTLARIAYVGVAKEFNFIVRQIVNVSYVPVVKNYIDEITFKFTDQRNNLLLFMNVNRETFIRLHFKPKNIYKEC